MPNFFYQVGSVTTTKPWPRPTYDRVRRFFLDETIQQLAEKYNIHIVGGFLYNKLTWDVDLALVYNYNDQTDWSIIESDIDIINDTALNTYNLLLDVCLLKSVYPITIDQVRSYDEMHVLIKPGYHKKILNNNLEFEHDLLKSTSAEYGKITRLGKYLVKSDRRGFKYPKKYIDNVSKIKDIDKVIHSIKYLDFLNMSEEDYQAVRIELNETI